MGFNAMTLRNYPPNQIALLDRAAMGFIGRTFEVSHLSKNGMQEWYAIGCNGRTFEELPPHYNCRNFCVFVPPVRYAPTVKDHVSLHSKS